MPFARLLQERDDDSHKFTRCSRYEASKFRKAIAAASRVPLSATVYFPLWISQFGIASSWECSRSRGENPKQFPHQNAQIAGRTRKTDLATRRTEIRESPTLCILMPRWIR